MNDTLSRYAEDGVDRDQRTVPMRFPIVNSPHTRWMYITAVVVSDLYAPVPPTDEELKIVASFHDQYMDYWYRDGWVNRMRTEHAFDVDGGANGRYLIKRENGGWGYRRRSWEFGPLFVPDFRAEPISLLACLNHFHSGGTGSPNVKWASWKDNHPDVFCPYTHSHTRNWCGRPTCRES